MSLDPPPPPSRRSSASAPAAPDLLIAGRLVQPGLNRIAGPDQRAPVQVEPKVMDVLVCLADTPGEVVSREALIDKVWQGAFVSDDVLTRSIGQLRRLFGDDPERPRVIETIRKRGYRLIAMPAPAPAPSEPASASGPAAALEPPAAKWAAPTPRPLSTGAAALPRLAATRRPAVAALCLLAVLAAAMLLLERPRLRTSPDRNARDRNAPDRASPERAAGRDVRLLPIAAVPADAIRPAISPEGTRVAFSWNGGGTGRDLMLYVAALGQGPPPVAITSHRGDAEHLADLDPSWSPDGALIAFTRQGRRSCELLTVPARGGAERSLGPCGNEDATKVSWSPDGRWLAISSRPPVAAASTGSRTARLLLISLASLNRRELTTPPPGIYGDYGPAFSPDGSRLAFVRALASDVEDIYQVALGAGGAGASGAPSRPGDAAAAPVAIGEATRVTFDNAALAGVDWLPGSRELVFASDRGGIYSLWRLRAPGGTPRLMAGSSTKIKHPSAARRRNVVVFESWIYDIDLWRVPLAPVAERPAPSDDRALPARPQPAAQGAGSSPPAPPGPAALEAAAREWSFQPQISPDGKRLVFGSTRSGTYELWTAAADGADPVQLTALGGPHLGTPRWSPDGRQIVFTAWPQGRAALYLVDAAGGAPAAVAAAGADPGGELAPSWSRDGNFLYFASRRTGSWQVWKLQLASGKRVQVTTGGGFAAQESADGRELLFSRIDRPGIWRRGLARGAEDSLVSSGLAPGDWGSWTVAGGGIYYLDRSAEPPVVQLLAGGAGRPVRVAALTDLAWSGFAVAPERRSLLYARSGRRECDVVRIENP
jgi:Tol biopolymer transport system component/DNA-binding winged helix-turn-helix (wHTH) protein